MPDLAFLTCPRCSTSWDSTGNEAGTFVSCPGCGAATRVPRSPDEPSAPRPIPTGDRLTCPACGGKATRPLSDEATRRLYAEYGRVPPLLILRPRRCRGCGHRWEVNPPRFALIFGIGLLSVGLIVGVAMVCLFVAFIPGVLAADEGEFGERVVKVLKLLSGVVGGTGLILGCWYGIRYYWQKLAGRSA